MSAGYYDPQRPGPMPMWSVVSAAGPALLTPARSKQAAEATACRVLDVDRASATLHDRVYDRAQHMAHCECPGCTA